MTRVLPFLVLVACAPAKPVVGPAAIDARPVGKAVMADADKRWEAFQTAQSPALVAALEQAKAAAPRVDGVNDRTPAESGPSEMKREPTWFPDRDRFRIVYSYTPVLLQHGFATERGGCGKYRNWPPTLPAPPQEDPPPPQPAPALQPSPMPCPPPVMIRVDRTWSATMGLVLEYTEDGALVSEQPSPPVPNLPKPAPAKH